MASKVLKEIATKLRFVHRPSKFVTPTFTVKHYFAIVCSAIFWSRSTKKKKKNAPCAFSHIYKKKP